MSARLLPLGGEGVCPDLIMTGIGERETSPMGLIGEGLAWGCIVKGGVAEGGVVVPWSTEGPGFAGFRPS